MKKLPCGIADFETVIKNDYYFFDNSHYIQKVEDTSSFILLLRPRRMGKSLFSSMMMSYYDLNKKEQFADLFGGLWIGKHPTQWANRFVTLRLDFSKVGFKSLDQIQVDFTDHCVRQFEDLFNRYSGLFTPEEIDEVFYSHKPEGMVTSFINVTRRRGIDTYLFIDEYDNFTNTVLSKHGVKAHEDLTHGTGLYREFFKSCKDAFTRIFMTGVTPVTYDDLTSGFSIATIISLWPSFNHIVGVSEPQLREMIEYYRSQGRIHRSTDEIVSEMKPWYNNFCFSSRSYGEEASIYNTNMVLSYMQNILDYDTTPEQMIDHQVMSDYDKIDFLVRSADIDSRESRIATIMQICTQGYTTGTIEPQFPAQNVGQSKYFKSMLFYYGTLTYGNRNERGVRKLIVPNKTMGELYLTYMSDLVNKLGSISHHQRDELDLAIENAALEGQWRPMIEQAGEIFTQFTSVRNSTRGEADVQGFLRGLFCLNGYFDLWPELELNHGFSDILLLPRSHGDETALYSYVIEIKYLKHEEHDIEKAVNEAKAQLRQYIDDNHLRDGALLRCTPLTPIYIVVHDRRFVRFDTLQLW
ncbi:MAG: ATP-binding protein [Bacteroidales bacterium]|nr:ATP-binding protein [Bacteroidales bacterium]